MSFRTVVINNKCKLSYSLNYMICRKETEETKVLIDEIRTLLINSTQVTITACLISELIRNKVKIIFTDESHNPSGEIVPYQNNFYTYRKIKEQIGYKKETCDVLWKFVVKEKIMNQARNLEYLGKGEQAKILYNYYEFVENGDVTNREGHSAKVYFNALFGFDFSRAINNSINSYLNYGYSIILSAISREIKTLGYLTEIGIHHIGESNSFNLSCDLVEPLRPLVDSVVINGMVDDENYKKEFIRMLDMEVVYNGRLCILENAIHLYVEDMFAYLKTDGGKKVHFIKYEL